MPEAARVVDTVSRLVGFDTTSRNSNLDLIAHARTILEGLGARVRLTYDDSRTKANLLATLGPDTDGGYVLSGHTDVVPVDGQDWSSDPFRAEAREGKLYGRGTADMKGFVGACLALAPEFARRDLKRPVHFAFSYDEEVGCVGVGRLIADLKEAGIKPALAVIGEPTEMRVVGAHKAGAGFRTRITGREGHSSAPHKGANAVMMAGEFLGHLAALQAELKRDADPRFDPPYTTIQANVISGGTALNILARQCEVTWEYRSLPGRGDDLAARVAAHVEKAILPKYRAQAKEAAIETRTLATYPGLAFEPDSPAVQLARACTGANEVDVVAYGTEAGLFQRAGIPAVVCGPGSIDQAHKADEFVELSQLAACETFLRKLADHAARR